MIREGRNYKYDEKGREIKKVIEELRRLKG